jgi:hypothetical protein
VITGFNTDIEHAGTIYHVQTEDKGLESPIILSLVYVGGAILASKRTPYNDLIIAGFDAALLNERLQRQHKLICAAISAGRVEDLKRLSQREASETAQTNSVLRVARDGARDNARVAENDAAPKVTDEQTLAPARSPFTPTNSASPTPSSKSASSVDSVTSEPHAPSVVAVAETRVEASHIVRAEPQVFEVVPAEIDDELHVSLMEEKDFHAGEIVTLRVRVTRGAFGEREAVRDASVVVKVLGTEFRPLILTSKSDADGVACVHLWLPRFTKGRAAILVRATADDCSAELRRAIHQN